MTSPSLSSLLSIAFRFLLLLYKRIYLFLYFLLLFDESSSDMKYRLSFPCLCLAIMLISLIEINTVIKHISANSSRCPCLWSDRPHSFLFCFVSKWSSSWRATTEQFLRWFLFFLLLFKVWIRTQREQIVLEAEFCRTFSFFLSFLRLNVLRHIQTYILFHPSSFTSSGSVFN